MSEVNKYGLSRAIPREIAREIRKNAGFGCVVCGYAFYHYDHYDPEFIDATEHQAKGITLLCGEIKIVRISKLPLVDTITYNIFTEGDNNAYFANRIIVHNESIQKNTK